MKKSERSSPADTKARNKGGDEVPHVLNQKFPGSPLKDCGKAGCPAAAHGGPDILSTTLEQLDMPEGSCSLWRAPAGASAWQKIFWQYLQPVGSARWSGQFLKDHAPWEGPMLEQFMKNCIPCKGCHAAAGERLEEKGVSGRSCYELATSPIPPPPVLLEGRR